VLFRSLDLGVGIEPCLPTKPECWFPATITDGPDRYGIYSLSWHDGVEGFNAVHVSSLRRSLTEEACGEQRLDEAQSQWVAPEIPCTLLMQLHWEASEDTWREHAVTTLRDELQPDTVIADFDWHVIFRFDSVDRCGQAYDAIKTLLDMCEDAERCYTHPYIRTVQHVGREPQMRLNVDETGRAEL